MTLLFVEQYFEPLASNAYVKIVLANIFYSTTVLRAARQCPAE